MSIRQVNRFAWVVAVTAGLGGSTACTKEETPPASSASATHTKTFQFAPPEGLQYVRADRRRRETAIVGTPLRRLVEEEFTWNIGIERRGDAYHVNQVLTSVNYSHDGRTVAKGKAPKGISAELVLDESGNLKEVNGLEKAAEVLRTSAMPGEEKEAARVFTPDFLERVITARYKMLFGDVIGHTASPGSTWTVTNPAGSVFASKTVTVTGQETCDATICARLKVEFKMNPEEASDAAADMVKSRVSASGGDPTKVTVRDASYGMNGSMLIDPATTLNHGTTLNEGGTVTVVDPDQKALTVEVRGTTEYSYSYASGPGASHPAAQTKSRVAAE